MYDMTNVNFYYNHIQNEQVATSLYKLEPMYADKLTVNRPSITHV